MKEHEFYQQYANLPISRRNDFLSYAFDYVNGKYLTPYLIYKEIKKLDKNDIVRKKQLLRIAERYFNLPEIK